MLIIKERDFPHLMLNTEILNQRLPLHHEKKERVNTSAGRRRAGYVGEKSIDFYLNFLSNDYRTFHFLRLPDSHGYFQMDTIIMTPGFILIIDVKNINGTVVFDEMGQCIREKNDETTVFDNPIKQIRLQQFRLQSWMKEFGIPPLPIIPLVVYSNRYTILKNPSNNPDIPKIVIRKDNLKSKIEELSHNFSRPILSSEEMDRLGELFIGRHTPEDPNVLKEFSISFHDLMKGVFCPDCRAIPMLRKAGVWNCMNCGRKSRDAHISALIDYYMLFGNMITNRQARIFLKLNSARETNYLLNQLQLEYIGRTSDRRYILNLDTLISKNGTRILF